MNMWLWFVLSIVCGVLWGLCITFLFGKFPESWLQDYDYDVNAKNFRLSKRMKIVPHGIISCIGLALSYCLSVFFAAEYFIAPHYWRIAVIFLLMPVLFLILMSDKLNRIIPDQFSIFILIIGIISAVGDYTDGTIWFSAEAKWFFPILNRVIAAIVGGGFLWLVGFLSMTFAGKEGMGQGDMKLMFAL